METCDVAMIGAGPAGVMAAWTAAREGARAVLLEREAHPGRKPCAEGILSEVLEDAEVSPSAEFAINHIRGAVLYGPDEKKRVNVGGEGYILDKPALLNVLAERARDAGAELEYGRAVENVIREDGHLLMSGKNGSEPLSLRSRIVLCCDVTD